MKIPILIILVLFFITGCTKLEDPTQPIDIDNIISLTLVPQDDESPDEDLSMVLADSNSVRIIKATIGPSASAEQTIVFNTTHGVITKVGEAPNSGSSQTLSIEAPFRDVTVQLNALSIPADQVIVSGSIGNNTNTTILQFTPAYPENFQINPLAVIGDTLTPISVEVEAFRQASVVSEDIRFRISTSAPDSLKLNYPQFVPLKNQIATFQIENISKEIGTVLVSIIMPDGSADSLTKTFEYIYE